MHRHEFDDLPSLAAAIDTDLGASDWVLVDQAMIDRFADAAGGDHWMHIDPVQSASGPFGCTIAQGMLVLSLGAPLVRKMIGVVGIPQGLHYGFEKVRFVAPVRVDSQIRVVPRISDVTFDDAGGAKVTTDLVIELKGSAKPAATAQTMSYYKY